MSNNQDVKYRLCIGVLCLDKSDKARRFKSEGPYNRQCEACNSAAKGISVKNLSRAGEVLEGVEFMN